MCVASGDMLTAGAAAVGSRAPASALARARTACCSSDLAGQAVTACVRSSSSGGSVELFSQSGAMSIEQGAAPPAMAAHRVSLSPSRSDSAARPPPADWDQTRPAQFHSMRRTQGDLPTHAICVCTSLPTPLPGRSTASLARGAGRGARRGMGLAAAVAARACSTSASADIAARRPPSALLLLPARRLHTVRRPSPPSPSRAHAAVCPSPTRAPTTTGPR